MKNLREKDFWGEVLDMSEVTVVVENSFHNTRAYMTVDGEADTVSAAEVDRVQTELCGMSDCTCSGVPIVGHSAQDAAGLLWTIV